MPAGRDEHVVGLDIAVDDVVVSKCVHSQELNARVLTSISTTGTNCTTYELACVAVKHLERHYTQSTWAVWHHRERYCSPLGPGFYVCAEVARIPPLDHYVSIIPVVKVVVTYRDDEDKVIILKHGQSAIDEVLTSKFLHSLDFDAQPEIL